MDNIIEQAIDKIKAEMSNNASLKIIGEHVLKHLEVNKKAARSIVEGKKTIKGSIAAMRKEAEKVKVGNMAILTEEEGFKIVDKYFGFVGVQEEMEVHEAQKEEVKTKKKFSMGLADLGL